MYSEDKNSFLDSLNRYKLLIIDDLGMERGTEYALEQVFSVIDARSKSGKPLIVTTNLTLSELQNPPDLAHHRIYSRVLAMCTPILFTGGDMRREQAQKKLDAASKIFSQNNRSDVDI